MDSLIAIALLCQLGAAGNNAKYVDNKQLQCQKELINCYYKKTARQVDLEGNKKYLYDCALERQPNTLKE